MKYIYFDADNLSLLVQWLHTYPSERYVIVIGSSSKFDRFDVLTEVTNKGSLHLGMWLIERLAGDQIRIITTSSLDIPPGVEL